MLHAELNSITTIVPAYNAERYVVQAIRSALDQSLDGMEIIVCDDASLDSTVDAIATIHDDRVRVVSNKINLGPGPSRDHGIRFAQSRWVALLDADDAWHATRLAQLLDAATQFDADVIFDDTLLCHDVDGRLVPWRSLHGTRAFGGSDSSARRVRIEDFITSDRLLIHPVIRTDFIRQHGICHSARRFGEDAEFFLRLAMAGAKFCYVPRPMYHYRISPGSLTAQANDRELMRKCLEECARWDGWAASTQKALRTKIATLRDNETLYDLAAAVRGKRFAHAARLLAAKPELLKQLPRRLGRQIQYQMHRILHRGAGR